MKKLIGQLISSLMGNDREDDDVSDNGFKVPTSQKDSLEATDEFLGYEAFITRYDDRLIPLTSIKFRVPKNQRFYWGSLKS